MNKASIQHCTVSTVLYEGPFNSTDSGIRKMVPGGLFVFCIGLLYLVCTIFEINLKRRDSILPQRIGKMQVKVVGVGMLISILGILIALGIADWICT